MKRSFICIFTFALFISIFYVLMHAGSRDVRSAAETVMKAFEMTGAEATASEIYIRGRSENPGFNEEMSLSLLVEIVSGIGSGTGGAVPVFCPIDTDFAIGHEVNYIIDENKKIHMTVLDQKGPETGNTLLISLYDISSEPELQKCYEAVTEVLDKYSIDHEINITVTGFVKGKLDDDETADIFDRAMGSTGASRVEGINDNGLVSISAFSPYISGAVRTGGKRVNLSMAARYSSFEDRTYIWVASPVITTEY